MLDTKKMTYNQYSLNYSFLDLMDIPDDRLKPKAQTQQIEAQPIEIEVSSDYDVNEIRYHIDYDKIHVISFSSTNAFFSKERFHNEAAEFGFKYIKIYTEEDFLEDYKYKYGLHFNDKRGYGYWSWKSYIVQEELKYLKEDEYLVYADCGSSFKIDNKNIFNGLWMNKLIDSKTGIFCPGTMEFLEMEWNKIACVDYMNQRFGTDYSVDDDSLKQNAATIILFRKTPISVKFVNEWFDICNNHYELITDQLSDNENPHLREHRHDLSVFSLLCHIYNVSTISSTQYGIDDKENAPIYASKIKIDKNTYLSTQKNNNVDIFICTHKDFELPYNPVYSIICGEGLLKSNYPVAVYEDNCKENPHIFKKEYSYAEGSRINYIRRNIPLKDYIGIAHYRKYMLFDLDPKNVPDIEEIFNNYDIILLDPQAGNIVYYYEINHFKEHIEKCIEIGRRMYPDYSDSFDRAYEDMQPIYYCNMFIMKTDDFYSMCDFVYGILNEFDYEMNFNTDEDIHRWIERNIKKIQKYQESSKNVNYQSRVDGFLTERLFTIWVWHNFSEEQIYHRPLNVIGNYQMTYGKTQL